MAEIKDYEMSRRANDLHRLGSAIAHFDKAVADGMLAMKKIASAFEAIGQAFTELTVNHVSHHSSSSASVVVDSANWFTAQDTAFATSASMCVNQTPTHKTCPSTKSSGLNNSTMSLSIRGRAVRNTVQGIYDTAAQSACKPANTSSSSSSNTHTDPARANGGAVVTANAAESESTRLDEQTNSNVRELARIFAEEARRVNEGSPFQAFNTGIHRDVLTRLKPVSEQLASMQKRRQELSEALMQYNQLKALVEKVERDCARKGKAFVNSKRHRKATEKRTMAMERYRGLRGKFNETYEWLMEMNDHAAAQIIHRYLVLNHEYLNQLNRSITRILPAIQEVYPLNNDYSSIQNAFIVDAIAVASETAPPLLNDVAPNSVAHITRNNITSAINNNDNSGTASKSSIAIKPASATADNNPGNNNNNNNTNGANNGNATASAGWSKPSNAPTRYVDCCGVTATNTSASSAATAAVAAPAIPAQLAITTELAEKINEWREESRSAESERSAKSNTQAAAMMMTTPQRPPPGQDDSHLVRVVVENNGNEHMRHGNYGGLTHMRFINCSTSVETCSAPMIIHNDEDMCLVDTSCADLVTADTAPSGRNATSVDSLELAGLR